MWRKKKEGKVGWKSIQRHNNNGSRRIIDRPQVPKSDNQTNLRWWSTCSIRTAKKKTSYRIGSTIAAKDCKQEAMFALANQANKKTTFQLNIDTLRANIKKQSSVYELLGVDVPTQI